MGLLQSFLDFLKLSPKPSPLASPKTVPATVTLPSAASKPVTVPTASTSPIAADGFIFAPGSVTVASAVKIRRAQPSTQADVISIVQAGVIVPVLGYTNNGEKINGNAKWYKIKDENWFWSGAVRDVVTFTSQVLTEGQYAEAAAILNVEVATIKAVNAVESSGSGFLPDGRPKILFEGHIFWRELKKVPIDPVPLERANADILYPRWDIDAVRPLYKLNQYERLEKAKKIDVEAALKSASWGAFQIMGMNHVDCGYQSVKEFVSAQDSAANQLKCFCHFLKKNNLDDKLRDRDWAGFALRYNGASYAKNKYDEKLESAYDRFSA